MNKKVLYLGNFNPNLHFASYNRAIGVLSIFKQLGWECHISIHDSKHSLLRNDNQYFYHFYKFSKVDFYTKASQQIKIIKSIPNLDLVVLYNYPSKPMAKIMKFCKKNNIKVVADLTEWYNTSGMNFLFKPFKHFDTQHRLKKLSKKTDGIIVTSELAKNQFKDSNVIKIYPIFSDKHSLSNNIEQSNKKPLIGYAGDIGRKKDDLVGFVHFLQEQNIHNYRLMLMGRIDNQTLKYLRDNKVDFEYFGLCNHEFVTDLLLKCDCQAIYRECNRSNNFGFPSKFAESICLNLPVITTNISDLSTFEKDPGVYIIGKSVVSISEFLRSLPLKSQKSDSFLKFTASNYIEELKTFLDSI